MTYPASHILLSGETVEQAKQRKANAIGVAEQLRSKATVPSIAEYWSQVQDGCFRDLARLEEI